MTTQFIAHTDTPRTFADKKGATKAIKRDLAKHDEAHGDVLFETGFDIQPSGDRFGVIVFCDLTPSKAVELVGAELSGYVIDPQVKEDKKADAPKPPSSRRKGQVSVAPTAPLIQCRANSKQQSIVDALAAGCTFDKPVHKLDDNNLPTGEVIGTTSAVGGVTLEGLRKVCVKKDGVTPWDDNSIRSALYYDLKDKGYGTFTRFEGDVAHYTLVLPVGIDAPLAAKASKTTS
jgi:hypothetical protein